MKRCDQDEIEADISASRCAGDPQAELVWNDVEAVLDDDGHERWTARDVRKAIESLDRLIRTARKAQRRLRRTLP